MLDAGSFRNLPLSPRSRRRRQSETQDEIAILRLVSAAGRRTTTPGGAVTAAAAERSQRASRRPGRIALRGVLVLAGIVPILAPLPDVAVHVEQAEGVSLEPADGGREHVAVLRGDGLQGRDDLLGAGVGNVGHL